MYQTFISIIKIELFFCIYMEDIKYKNCIHSTTDYYYYKMQSNNDMVIDHQVSDDMDIDHVVDDAMHIDEDHVDDAMHIDEDHVDDAMHIDVDHDIYIEIPEGARIRFVIENGVRYLVLTQGN